MPWHSAHIFTACPLSCHESLSDSVFNSKCILSTVFPWSARLPVLSEKEMRSVLSLLNPHCVPELLLFFWVVTNHSFNDVPIILSRINSKCTGAVYYWDSLFSFFFPVFLKVGILFSSSAVFWHWFCFFTSIYKKENSRAINFWVQIAFALLFWWLILFLPRLWQTLSSGEVCLLL